MEQKCQRLEECENKLLGMINLENELLAAKEELAKNLSDKDNEAIQVHFT